MAADRVKTTPRGCASRRLGFCWRFYWVQVREDHFGASFAVIHYRETGFQVWAGNNRRFVQTGVDIGNFTDLREEAFQYGCDCPDFWWGVEVDFLP